MDTVQDFSVLDSLGNYDREDNPNGLTVQELLPRGISWLSGGMRHKVEHADGLIATKLSAANGIALVLSPFNKALNDAMILNPDGTVMWDVRNVAWGVAPGCILTDVYYVLDELCFFIYFSGQNYRFSFDVVTGGVGKIIISY
jgi:hypothetical protein